VSEWDEMMRCTINGATKSDEETRRVSGEKKKKRKNEKTKKHFF
jgi:hypothetical protein